MLMVQLEGHKPHSTHFMGSNLLTHFALGCFILMRFMMVTGFRPSGQERTQLVQRMQGSICSYLRLRTRILVTVGEVMQSSLGIELPIIGPPIIRTLFSPLDEKPPLLSIRVFMGVPTLTT